MKYQVWYYNKGNGDYVGASESFETLERAEAHARLRSTLSPNERTQVVEFPEAAAESLDFAKRRRRMLLPKVLKLDASGQP